MIWSTRYAATSRRAAFSAPMWTNSLRAAVHGSPIGLTILDDGVPALPAWRVPSGRAAGHVTGGVRSAAVAGVAGVAWCRPPPGCLARGSHGMNAAFMSSELHERGIHAVSRDAGGPGAR
jgi:hypothetical protein